MNSPSRRLLPFALAGGALATWLSNFDVVLGVGYGVWVLALLRSVGYVDRPFNIRWLMILFAATQWVVVPSLEYGFRFEHFKYHMYVPESEYYLVAVPGLIAMLCGLLSIGDESEARNQRSAIDLVAAMAARHQTVLFILLGISLAASAFGLIIGASFSFIVYLAINLKYAAILLIVLSSRRDRFLWLGIVAAVAAAEAAATSLFHESVLWGILIGGVVLYREKVPVLVRLVALVGLVVVGCVLQSVKNEYRTAVWQGGEKGSAGYYVDLSFDKVAQLGSGSISVRDLAESAVMRLNQGWIISRIISYVPSREPFAGGATILDALQAVALPRFLAPDKAGAGGRSGFTRFTGLQLAEGTSMGTSVLGEAYGNFGHAGSIIFMLAFGILVAAALNYFAKKILDYPIMLIFIPGIFLHAIKAESDFVTVTNFIVKSGVFHLCLASVIYLVVLRRSGISTSLRLSHGT